MENKEVRKQNDVIVNFKTMTNKKNENVNGNAPRKLKFVTVEVNEHQSEHGEMFSIDLNYREQLQYENSEVSE